MIRRAILLSLLVLPLPALAQTPQSGGARIDINGEAPSACVVRAPSGATGINATVEAAGAGRSEIRITQLVDPASATPRATSAELSLPIICNAPHRLTVRSGNGGLLREGAARGGAEGTFSEFLPYRLAAVWAGQQTQGLSESAGGLSIDSSGGGAGQLLLSIRVEPGGSALVAGRYADDVVISFAVAN